MEFLGYFSALIIGLVMGLIGGGGSILSVPIFVYVFGFDAVTATALSASLDRNRLILKQHLRSGFHRFWAFCFHAG